MPIYWGTRKISEFFDPAGMICFERAADVNDILAALTVDDYWRRMPAIKKNYDLAAHYVNPTEKLKQIILRDMRA